MEGKMIIKRESVEPLFERREVLYKEARAVDKAIKALQEICEHDEVPDGNDSHKDHYKCRICEATWSI